MEPIPGVPVFRWCEAPDATGTIALRTLDAQFGDGYLQTAGDGINNEVSVWPLQFIGTPARIAPILAFLRERAGWKSFHWTPPDGELALFRCKQLSYRRAGPTARILAATFEQVFSAQG